MFAQCMAKRRDRRALLEERNNQNAFLRDQLIARDQHIAHLEARVLSTLDTLDELQASSSRESEHLQRENARLLEKLDTCRAILREADREKHEMSDAVLQLAAKVESCNDYSQWRISRIEFSQDVLLHPIRCLAKSSGSGTFTKGTGDCSCARAYSPAIIEELSDSLQKEKRAHALTVEEAERRVTSLQSRLAFRDADIARRAATCRCIPAQSSLGAPTQPCLLSEEERAQIAATSVVRNLVLDKDVVSLVRKLDQETQSRKPVSLYVEQGIQTESTSLVPHFHRQGMDVANQPVSDDECDTVPEALETLDEQIADLNIRLRHPIIEKEGLNTVLHNGFEEFVSDASLSIQRQTRTGNRKSQDKGYNAHSEQDFEDVLLLEEQCIRLMRSEENLRSSVESLQHRYERLVDENARLKTEISELRRSDQYPSDILSPLSLPALEASAIDLAFPPLQPDREVGAHTDGGHPLEMVHTRSSSSASSSSSPLTPTWEIKPCEIPLPRTPSSENADEELEIMNDVDTRYDVEEREPRSRNPHPPLSLESQEHSELPSLSDASIDTGGGRRNEQIIERELVQVRLDTEMREQVEEVRDLMANLASRINEDLRGS